MEKLCYVFSLCLLGYTTVAAQSLTTHEDFPGAAVFSSLWDLEQDDSGRLYTCSGEGNLFIKENGEWTTIDLNMDSNAQARGIAVDADGVVWVSANDGIYKVENGAVTDHITAANSALPEGSLREIKAFGNDLWVVIQSNGLVKKTGDTYTHYTMDNSPLNNIHVEDIDITADGRLVLTCFRDIHIIAPNGDWTTYNMQTLTGSFATVSAVDIDHNQDIWIGAQVGVLKYNAANDTFDHLNDEYGQRNYTDILFTPNGELWLCQLFEGLYYYKDGNGYFFEGGENGQPSQVFDFIHYQDTTRVIGNIGVTVTGLTVDLPSSSYVINPSPIQLYPNPTADLLRFTLPDPGPFQVRIYNPKGQLVLETTRAEDIDVSSLVPGIYWLDIRHPERKQLWSATFQISR